MKLKSFRIQNYKSIIDSGICRLSDVDNITILAGQNESGKSSILQALKNWDKEENITNAIRTDEELPEITCTFTYDKNEYFLNEIETEYLVHRDIINFLRKKGEFSLIRKYVKKDDALLVFDTEMETELDDLFDRCAKKEEGKKKDSTEAETKEKRIDDTDDLADAIYPYTPRFIFFDDFCDLLPDDIKISDLKSTDTKVQGYTAVKNIERLLETDFVNLDNLPDDRREVLQATYHEEITANFNEKWKQRIGEGRGAKIHIRYNQGKAEGAAYLKFFIETKKGEWLPPSKRSQGFKWFLSFFMEIKAQNASGSELLILFDEPGLYLHTKAQSDMLSVFEELAEENQIIYSTHSPYLIDTSKLHRIRLVLNTKKHGTTVEKLTTIKIGNQHDALKPVVDAIGLEIAHSFSLASKNNVILEGISDYYYFTAMKILLKIDSEFAFLPAMGASNSHLLMEMCIGWGLNWRMIFDGGGATKDFNRIKRNFFNDDTGEANKFIYRLEDCAGVEDMFSIADLKLVNPTISESDTRANADIVNALGGKELFARIFLEKVNNKQIRITHLDKSTVNKFKKAFEFIVEGFKKT